VNICFVSQEYPPATDSGGIGSQTWLKAHGMASRGHGVSVVCAGASGVRTVRQEGPVRVIRIPGFHRRMPLHTEPARWLTWSAEIAATLARLKSETRLDLIDFPEYGGEGYIYLLNRTDWDHTPASVHLHGPLVMFAHAMGWPGLDSEFYRVGSAMESACFRLADAVYSSSRCSAMWCAEHYGRRTLPIPVLHTGVDVSLFKPSDVVKRSHATIVFVGRIAWSKGIDMLVEAACSIAGEFPGLRVRLIGTGDPECIAALRSKARECGQPRLLEFPGYVSRTKLPAHLNEAHVFAAPSEYEGGPGFVYLEAMACGLPVIACQGSGASEIICDQDTGFLVPPRDAGALARTLRKLLSDPGQQLAVGMRARLFAQSEGDSSICLDRLENFYRSVARRDAPKRGACGRITCAATQEKAYGAI
jgi:glycogen synthase